MPLQTGGTQSGATAADFYGHLLQVFRQVRENFENFPHILFGEAEI